MSCNSLASLLHSDTTYFINRQSTALNAGDHVATTMLPFRGHSVRPPSPPSIPLLFFACPSPCARITPRPHGHDLLVHRRLTRESMAHRGSSTHGHAVPSSGPSWSFLDFTIYVDRVLGNIIADLKREWGPTAAERAAPEQLERVSRRIRDVERWQSVLDSSWRVWSACIKGEVAQRPLINANVGYVARVLRMLPLHVEAAPMLVSLSLTPSVCIADCLADVS